MATVTADGPRRAATPAAAAECIDLLAALRRFATIVAALLLAGCGERAAQPENAAAAAPPPLQFAQESPDPLRHGERIARVLGCRGCHGDDMTGHEWVEDPDEAVLFTSNLRRAVPLYSDAALERAIRGGVRLDGSPLWAMPSELFTDLSAPDMAALIRYLRAQPPTGEMHPRPVFGPSGRREIASGEWKSAPDEVRLGRGRGPAAVPGGHDWARYMIRATCSECHGLDLRGRQEAEGPRGPPDLAVVAGYSRDQFRHLMRTGLPPGGRDLGLMARVSRGRFAFLTQPEVDAIYDYLVARAASP
jgi:mono/diheme cytochrome c family protein